MRPREKKGRSRFCLSRCAGGPAVDPHPFDHGERLGRKLLWGVGRPEGERRLYAGLPRPGLFCLAARRAGRVAGGRLLRLHREPRQRHGHGGDLPGRPFPGRCPPPAQRGPAVFERLAGRAAGALPRRKTSHHGRGHKTATFFAQEVTDEWTIERGQETTRLRSRFPVRPSSSGFNEPGPDEKTRTRKIVHNGARANEQASCGKQRSRFPSKVQTTNEMGDLE